MTPQTKTMFIFQSAVVIVTATIGVLAILAPHPVIEGLLAGADIGIVIIDIIGLIIYARYVNRRGA